jgi:hypothetical protein
MSEAIRPKPRTVSRKQIISYTSPQVPQRMIAAQGEIKNQRREIHV